jgi:hypothetical protein
LKAVRLKQCLSGLTPGCRKLSVHQPRAGREIQGRALTSSALKEKG